MAGQSVLFAGLICAGGLTAKQGVRHDERLILFPTAADVRLQHESMIGYKIC